MFTGIIQSVGKLRQEKNILEIEILDNLFDMAIGDSIAVDGICLTVKEIFQNKFTVDVSEETLKKTTLGVKSNLNQIVNLEPALRLSDRLGGHIVSGHVDGLGTVDQVGFSSHGSYSLIKDAINCEVFTFCSLHLHYLDQSKICLLYTSPSPRDKRQSRMPSSA